MSFFVPCTLACRPRSNQKKPEHHAKAAKKTRRLKRKQPHAHLLHELVGLVQHKGAHVRHVHLARLDQVCNVKARSANSSATLGDKRADGCVSKIG